MDWIEAIRLWRALPEEEQRRRRRAALPRKVARSFAFEGEPVDLAMLEAELGRWPVPVGSLTPATNAQLSEAQLASPEDSHGAQADASVLEIDLASSTTHDTRTAFGTDCLAAATVNSGNT